VPVGTGVTCTQDCTTMTTPCTEVTAFTVGQAIYAFLSWSTGHDYYNEQVGYRWNHNGSVYSEYLFPAYTTHPDGLIYCLGPVSNLPVGSGSIDILWVAAGQSTAQVIGTSNTYTVTTTVQCSTYTTQATCTAAGCYWYNNTCNSTPQPACNMYTTQATCTAAGCYWYNNTCNSTPQPTCSSYTTQATCTAAGCYWWTSDNACHATAPTTCSTYTTQATCTAAGCYWWTSDNACHSTPETLCSSYTTQATCTAAGCYWYNNTCNANPPPACTTYLTKETCTAAGCYWYADIPIPYIMPEKCHSTAQDPMTKYLVYGGIALAGLSVIILLLRRRS